MNFIFYHRGFHSKKNHRMDPYKKIEKKYIGLTLGYVEKINRSDTYEKNSKLKITVLKKKIIRKVT